MIDIFGFGMKKAAPPPCQRVEVLLSPVLPPGAGAGPSVRSHFQLSNQCLCQSTGVASIPRAAFSDARVEGNSSFDSPGLTAW